MERNITYVDISKIKNGYIMTVDYTTGEGDNKRYESDKNYYATIDELFVDLKAVYED